MLPRQSTDDDRPVGLKYTRNHFFNFPKKDNNSIKRAPSNASSVLSSISANDVSNQQPITTERSRCRPQQQMATSPTLPVRSPFRIRDSQQQQQNNKLSHEQKSIRSNSSIDIDSSISSSSSSSIVTLEDDLAHELENLWKYKSTSSTASNVAKTAQVKKASINSDDMLLQLLISQAMIDAKDYKILKYEEIETLKQHHERLKKQIRNSASRLEIDKKIHDTSQSLAHLSANKNRESVLVLLDEAVEADRKVKILTQRLTELRTEEVNTQYQILQHTAGVLYLGMQNMEQTHLDKGLSNLQSEVETIKQTLRTIVGQYVGKNSVDTLSISELLDQLETQLKRYKAQSTALETKLEAAEQSNQLRMTTEHKLQSELHATKMKRISAEAKCNELQQQIDNFVEPWTPLSRAEPSHSTSDENKGVERELSAELEQAYADVHQLKQTVSDLETQAANLKTQVAVYQEKEDKLKTDIDHYRDKVCQLRADKENWEQTMKKEQAFLEENSAVTFEESLSRTEADYGQQLEEQEQKYQTQLKEQAAILDQTTRQCEKLQEEYDKLLATGKDLELLIEQKQKALDARDIQINQLEDELRQQQQQIPPEEDVKTAHLNRASNIGSIDSGTSDEIQKLQALFLEKEAQWIEQSTVMEANFEGILREYDRLTGTAMEFEADKLDYERRITELTEEVNSLEACLLEQRSKNIGCEGDTPTTASLRKEFRKMINDMKTEHQRMLEREIEEKKRLEKQLKDLKHEREMSRYERSNKGVQTFFVA
ncbi:Up-regulated during septation-domain-containing protein [Mycotypha africana]|uniref:Up-regulated during septation-domain-containing protein n=1 Tax=Mycotypha africana TaxID=64632 RepID=UPI00230027D3|nr:Up-regulated during septation-domain-containing protein [Mycotypha africana]KAI8968315.1 Up-regulated during septation-domain-containing protein [Mycotypha africana]